MRALLRRVRRQCARRWHSFLPLAWLLNNAAGGDDEDNDLSNQICLLKAVQTSVSTTPPRRFLNADNNIYALLCALSALLALPPFLLLLFITGLSDHFFETPIDQFRWSNVDVRKQVIRDLLGPHLSNTNLRTDQSSALINPWPHLFPHPLIEPTCRQNLLNQKRSVLIIVKSAPDRLKRRDAVRATYGALKRYPPAPASADGRAEDAGASFRLRTIFVLGRPPNTAAAAAAQMDALEREAAAHGDLLVGDFADTYFNNTLKFVHSVRFARHHCAPLGNPVPYTLLLDDDYLLFPWNLVAELQRSKIILFFRHVPNERLYMGWRFDTSPFRLRWHKWRVSLDEFPFTVFPPYIAGGAVLLTGQTVAEFYAAIPHTRLFRLDDVYTGILAHLLAVQPQHNANFAFYRPAAALTTPTMIAVHAYAPAELRKAKTFILLQVIRDLLGPHLSNTNLRTDQSSALINPWPHLFPHPLIEPTCRQNLLNQKRSVLIIVKSAPDRLKRRDAVRATYGALKRYPPAPASADGRAEDAGASFRLRTIFVLGRPPNTAAAAAQMDALEREAAAHGDLLVGDFADTYFNNTLKFVHSVRFARHHCAPLGNPVPYTLLLDDDYLLFPWNLVAELQRSKIILFFRHVPNERLYMGWRFDTSPFRLRWHKWRVSLDEFPFTVFPPYIAGGAVLLTGQTVAEFYAAIPHTRLFRLDDVYTGILAHLLAVQPQHNANFAFYRPAAALTTPTMIAVHAYAPAELRKAYADAQRGMR
uniref:Uncharacterized protein n=1 Tax=Globodera rostochiensis TaxID=31243 RepID=A0A914HX10_GLORO